MAMDVRWRTQYAAEQWQRRNAHSTTTPRDDAVGEDASNSAFYVGVRVNLH